MEVHLFIFNSEATMRKGLLKFVVAVLSVVLSVVVVDRFAGKILDWMLPQISNQGDIGKTYYSLNDVTTPIVIVGSSRAAHHYVTSMVEDSLEMPAYNVGRDGCYFSYNCCIVNSILDRYTPELIIWENATEYLYEECRDPLVSLYSYYGKNQWVKSAVREELPWNEYMRLYSRLYQYNSTIHRMLKHYRERYSFTCEEGKGYIPLAPKKLRKSLDLEVDSIEYKYLSQTKVKRFRSILKRAKQQGVRMVVVDSPQYRLIKGKNLSSVKMRDLCEQYGMMFIDNSQLPYFLKSPLLFNDQIHLNDDGARVYSKVFLNQIKDYVEYGS